MLKWLLALVLVGVNLSVNANTQDTRNLLTLEAQAYRLTADISILALQEGGPRYQRRLDNTIASGNDVAVQLQQRWPGVTRQWQVSAEFVEDRRVVAAANSDVSFTNELEAVQNKLYAKIQQARNELSSEEFDPNEAAALVALIAMEQMVAEYMYYNINVFGGHAITNSRMADNASLFRNSVARIGDEDNRRKTIEAKWRFIEKTLLDYNQQSAAFIVMKTTDKIRSLLMA